MAKFKSGDAVDHKGVIGIVIQVIEGAFPEYLVSFGHTYDGRVPTIIKEDELSLVIAK